jgi:hypothetical protein
MGTQFVDSAGDTSRAASPHRAVLGPPSRPASASALERWTSSEAVLGIIALLVATGITFSSLLSTRNIPTYRDLLFFTWPLKHFFHERLLRGELPLWNPLLLMGTPYLANLQSGVFYPPSLLLLLPLPLGFNLFLFSHYVIALSGAWVWLRARGMDGIPAATGAAVFTLGGYLVSLLNLTNHLQAAAWAPWVLFSWSRFVANGRASDFLWLILALSVELLGGSPENLLLTLLAVVAWTVFGSRRAWGERARLFGYLALASMATAALCAVQLLPTLEYLAQSSRATSLSFEHIAHYSFQPVSVLQLLLPHSTALLPADAAHSLGPGFEGEISLIQSYYLGIVPLCLAVVGIVAGRERLLWAILIVFGIAMALGSHAPFFPALYGALPWVVGKLRYPEKFYFLVHLGVAALAAEGARLVLARRPESMRIALTASVTLLSIAVGLCLVRWLRPDGYLELIAMLRGRYLPPTAFVPLALDTYWKAQRLALVLGALITLLMLPGRVLRPKALCWLLLALVLVDLVSANRNLNQGMSWPELEARSPLIDPAEARAHEWRIFHGQTIESPAPGSSQAARRLIWWVPFITRDEDLDARYRLLWETMNSNAGMLYGIANVSGSDGITSASDDLLLSVMGALPLDGAVKLLRIFGAGYVLGPDPLPARDVTEIARAGDTPYRAFRVHDPLPLLYAVSRLRAEPSRATALFRLAAEPFDPEREAIVEALPRGWRDGGPDQALPKIAVVARSDGFWRFRIDGGTPSFIVLNESFFPGWEARVDGSPTPIIRTNAIVRGVAVDAGRHVVDLAYRPGSFRLGAAISLASIIVLAVAALEGSRRARRRAAAPGSS